MSPNTINVEFRNVETPDPTDLASFLSTVGEVKVEKTAYATKGVVEAIFIVLGVVGAWGAERYLLDPLADKFDAWIKTLGSLEGKQFKVSVQIQNSTLVSIETLQVSNPFIVREIWKYLKKASDLMAISPEKDHIDKVMLIPHTQQKVLVVGYTGKRPTHLLDLDKQQILQLKQNIDDDKSLDIIFWEINQLAVQLENLRRQPLPDEARIKVLEDEISGKLSSCL